MSPARTTAASKPRQQGPGRPKDLGKRAAILDAARSLFTEQGFAGVSMDGIAAKAGVSKLTVYSHFGDKDSLFSEAIRAQCQELMPDDLFQDAPEGPLRSQLEAIGMAFFAMISSDAAIATHRMMLNPSTGDAPIRRMFWEAGPQRINQAMADFLQVRAEANDLVIPDLRLAASQFFCLLKGELYSAMACGLQCSPTAEDVRCHVASSVDFFLRAHAAR